MFNSKLFRWLFPLYSAPFRGGYLSANRQFIDPLPVRVINFADHADRARHDRVVALVERMLALHAELGRVKVPYERAAVEAQVAATDRQIDQLVYELYGLTDDEIRVVEGTPAGA